jgi:DNA-binding transcriptional LysR family regulator
LIIPTDLANHHVVLMSHQGPTLELDNKTTEELFSLSIDSRLKCNEIEIIRQAALNDLGVASLPYLSVQTYLSSWRSVKVLPDYALTLSRGIYAVYPSRKYLAAKTRLLVDYLD